jgi:hypothetical protein
MTAWVALRTHASGSQIAEKIFPREALDVCDLERVKCKAVQNRRSITYYINFEV